MKGRMNAVFLTDDENTTKYYFDNAATTRTSVAVLEAMLPYFCKLYGNASAIYKMGQLSKKACIRACEQIGAAINASPKEIFFTSGGTESDNWAIKGVMVQALAEGKNHIITSAFEHPAILNVLKVLKNRGVGFPNCQSMKTELFTLMSWNS